MYMYVFTKLLLLLDECSKLNTCHNTGTSVGHLFPPQPNLTTFLLPIIIVLLFNFFFICFCISLFFCCFSLILFSIFLCLHTYMYIYVFLYCWMWCLKLDAC